VPELGAHAVVDAAQVDIDHLAPVIDRILLGADQRPADTGDVGRDVELAVRLHGMGDSLF
jgi:hypothetical protein